MSERWYVINPWPERMAAISEDPGGASGALAYVGREGRDKDADAALISASPELLQTLSDLIAVVETYDDAWNPDTALWDARRLASEVERKARGEQ